MGVISVGVAYFELKVMRSNRRDDIEAMLTKDQAYNALMSTKAISNSLKEMGKDTREAELMLERAQYNYDQRDYIKVISVTTATKDMLMHARDMPIASQEYVPAPKEEAKDEVTVHDVKRLPENYMQSKFLLTSTSDEIEQAKGKKDTADAEKLLSEAQSAFDSKDYNACVRICMKAKHAVSDKAETAAPAPVKVLDEKTAISCATCGAQLSEGDMFCGKCGTPAGPAKCTKCGAVLAKGDAFCRKCGQKLG